MIPLHVAILPLVIGRVRKDGADDSAEPMGKIAHRPKTGELI